MLWRDPCDRDDGARRFCLCRNVSGAGSGLARAVPQADSMCRATAPSREGSRVFGEATGRRKWDQLFTQDAGACRPGCRNEHHRWGSNSRDSPSPGHGGGTHRGAEPQVTPAERRRLCGRDAAPLSHPRTSGKGRQPGCPPHPPPQACAAQSIVLAGGNLLEPRLPLHSPLWLLHNCSVGSRPSDHGVKRMMTARLRPGLSLPLSTPDADRQDSAGRSGPQVSGVSP